MAPWPYRASDAVRACVAWWDRARRGRCRRPARRAGCGRRTAGRRRRRARTAAPAPRARRGASRRYARPDTPLRGCRGGSDGLGLDPEPFGHVTSWDGAHDRGPGSPAGRAASSYQEMPQGPAARGSRRPAPTRCIRRCAGAPRRGGSAPRRSTASRRRVVPQREVEPATLERRHRLELDHLARLGRRAAPPWPRARGAGARVAPGSPRRRRGRGSTRPCGATASGSRGAGAPTGARPSGR